MSMPRRFNHSFPFTPILTGLVEVGTVAKVGEIRLLDDMVFIHIKLIPAALSTLASTFLTTYVNNLPYLIKESAGMQAQNITNLAVLNGGILSSGTTQFYLPTIAATGDAVSFNGWYLRKY